MNLRIVTEFGFRIEEDHYFDLGNDAKIWRSLC
jgi:hypothetical protein